MKEKIKENAISAALVVLILLIAGFFLFKAISAGDLSFSDKEKITGSANPYILNNGKILPRDEGQHQNLQAEWWYFAGHLEDEKNSDNKFGFTLIFNKNSFNKNLPNTIFNLANGVNGENLSGLIFFDKYDVLSENNLEIVSGKNHWLSSPDGGYEIHFEYAGKEIDLNLTPLKKPFISSLTGQSFYYQQTRLAASGSLFLSDKQYKVKGFGWTEHQGFEDSVPWKSWRWHSLQLSNNAEIAFVTGLYLKDGRSSEKNVLFIFKERQEVVDNQEYEIEYLEYWTHPKTNVHYPIKWQLDIPNRNISLIVTSLVSNQVIDEAGGFYEGTCLVSGTFEGKSVTGRAQFEFMP